MIATPRSPPRWPWPARRHAHLAPHDALVVSREDRDLRQANVAPLSLAMAVASLNYALMRPDSPRLETQAEIARPPATASKRSPLPLEARAAQ